jgi:hypothetical protein
MRAMRTASCTASWVWPLIFSIAPVLALGACGGSSPPEAAAPQPVQAAASPEPSPAAEGEPPEAPEEAEPEPPPAPTEPPPWAADPVPAAGVPRVYLAEHKKAANRASCPLLVLTDLGAGAGARPRRATFYGGWAVAYDKKGLPGSDKRGEACDTCGRSAFGVAGAGIEKGADRLAFPHEVKWADGSTAGYGPEGGSGPKFLAFVEAADAGCLYNVWSALGEEHLVALLRGLRRVSR